MADTDKVTFDPPITGGIVVGHDGSRTAQRALEWAVDAARHRQQPLHVVRAWVLSSAMRDTHVPFGTVPSFDECQAAIEKLLAEDVDAVGVSGVEVHRHVVHGSAARALMAAAETADMLVVGERGHGGFAGLRLGSVADQVISHSPVTAVVVR